MRPIYGCPENFWESSLRTQLLFKNVRTKFEVRSFTSSWDNYRGSQKIWAVPGYAHAPFSPKILKGFCSDGPHEYTCHQCHVWNTYGQHVVHGSRPESRQKSRWLCWEMFTAWCYAKSGYATVCLSVTLRYRDHIGWNTSKNNFTAE